MSRCLSAILALTLCVAAVRAQDAATWDEQNHAMGYLLIHLSGLNAIKGLNLTRAQAQRLRAMAQEVEGCGCRAPSLTKAFRPDLSEVRDTYLELRGVLLKGGEVSPELEKKVTDARRIESAVIRLSLANPQAMAASCAHCHGEPRAPDVRAQADAALSAPAPPAYGTPQEISMAHLNGIYGAKGMTKLAALAPEVGQLLTDAQKDIVANFSCCLVPPKALSDPVRAGQAPGGEKVVELLRNVRAVPAAQWPAAKNVVLAKVEVLLAARSPGVTGAQKAQERERIAGVLDKARALSDTEFEMDKANLAAELQGTRSTLAGLTPTQRRYMTAYFLLVPGSAEVYDSILKRMDEK